MDRNITEVRRAFLQDHFPGAGVRLSTSYPNREEFILKFDDPDQQFRHVAKGFAIYRDDTFPYQQHARALMRP